MDKPTLYIDVDGVLFGLYGDPECFQLRPGVSSFLTWATKHFECKWLTCWPEKALRELAKATYGFSGAPFPEYVEWGPGNKTDGIDYTREWFWIDDGPVGREMRDLADRGVRDRLIRVDGNGPDELERVRTVLQERLDALKAKEAPFK